MNKRELGFGLLGASVGPFGVAVVLFAGAYPAYPWTYMMMWVALLIVGTYLVKHK